LLHLRLRAFIRSAFVDTFFPYYLDWDAEVKTGADSFRRITPDFAL
jgi:hypothetical protein